MKLKPADNEYIELKKALAEMSDIVTKMVNDSVETIISGDTARARAIMAEDARVDDLEIEIDEICTKIIARYEPKAADLRYIITALRIITDLERIGDHARNICKQSIKLALMPRVEDYPDLPKMAGDSAKMVQSAIKAFFTKDEALAQEILAQDEAIDEYQNSITQALIQCIINDVTKTKSVIRLINIVRRLERIADHAKNIAELVSFMKSGRMPRKTHGEPNA